MLLRYLIKLLFGGRDLLYGTGRFWLAALGEGAICSLLELLRYKFYKYHFEFVKDFPCISFLLDDDRVCNVGVERDSQCFECVVEQYEIIDFGCFVIPAILR